jgi:hypothetical protein
MCVRPIHCVVVDNAIKMKETINYINKSLNADKEWNKKLKVKGL